MIIVAGALWVDPADRDAYVADCLDAARQARAADGCLDFAVSPDPIDAGRVDVAERWASPEQLGAIRGAGPDDDLSSRILRLDVARYEVPT